MIYSVAVFLGVVVGLVLLASMPRDDSVPPRVRRVVRVAALVGAVVGAYALQLPADLAGWAAVVPGAPAHPLGGRTVLGGLLGGWLAVEVAKLALGHRGATGDAFALPLAASLTFGRLGCTFTGCCPGRAIAADSPWAVLSIVHHDPPRLPATLLEANFHALAAMLLLVATLKDVLRGRRLAAYLAAYAVARFALEAARANPPIGLGLTYYQWLSLPLFAICVLVLWRRRALGSGAVPDGPVRDEGSQHRAS